MLHQSVFLKRMDGMAPPNNSLLTYNKEDFESLLAVIKPVSQELHFSPKVIFSAPGDNISCLFFIAKGQTKHYIDNVDGSAKVLYYLNPGWFFGETPCLLNVPTGLSSQTETEAVLYRIGQKQVQNLLDENQLFRNTVMACQARKMLMMRNEIENLTFNPCKERILRLFCLNANREKLIDGLWHPLHTEYTHAEIGEIIGGNRVTVSRLISELNSEGTLRVLNRHIQIHALACSNFTTLNCTSSSSCKTS